jgi:HSP20 family protein
MNGSDGQRWDPVSEMQREVGRFFDGIESFQNRWASRPFPAINLYDAGDSYFLTADLPGMAPDAFSLSITGETLLLEGQRTRPEPIDDESYRRQERAFGRWARTVSLPERVDNTRVTADLANGLLTVTLPKVEEPHPRQIAITATGT